MYRLLIVDDERMALESTYALLATQEDLELELLTADSAVKAVSILESEQIDIAIMDINMPQMTGLELYDVMQEKWPQCKAIFLTGYADFDYVYKVHTHARYVLKADSEEVLLEAVRDSIKEIEKDLILASATESDIHSAEMATLYRSSNFMSGLIDGQVNLDIVTNEILRKMSITIDLNYPVYAVMFECKAINHSSFERCELISEKMTGLIIKHFLVQNHYAWLFYRHRIFLLLQLDKSYPNDVSVKRISGICSLFQKALQANTSETASILLTDCAISFQRAVSIFGLFNDRLSTVETGDIQTTSPGSFSDTAFKSSISDLEKEEIYRVVLRIEAYFNSEGKEEILRQIEIIKNTARREKSMHDLFLLEVYCRISAILLRAIKQYNIGEKIAFHTGIIDIYNVSNHKTWEQAFGYQKSIVEKIFELYDRQQTEDHDDLVQKIKHFIEDHIDGDTSLTALSDNLHFSREHLLRVFKKETGITVLQYINDRKFERAEKLLVTTEIPVKDISSMLGFNSTGYFIRFFKAKTGISPRIYREQNKEKK